MGAGGDNPMAEYDPKYFRYMSPVCLVEQLDFLVKDPADPDYLVLKERLNWFARKAMDRNPFGAGRPGRFDDSEKLEMARMKDSGKTYRQIAEHFECSTSQVHKCIRDTKSRSR